jgi:hypothetical protein
MGGSVIVIIEEGQPSISILRAALLGLRVRVIG